MHYMLIALTLGSAAVAVVMCALVVKMLREERRRSDARVEALLAMAGEPPRVVPDEARAAGSIESFTAAPTHPREVQHDDLELNPVAPVIGIQGLFAERETASPWGRRLVVTAACAAVLVAATAALNWSRTAPDTPGVTGTTSAAPLELLSLRHTADARSLTITGLVQNPRGGASFSAVTAVALLFAGDGSFISSGRAPLDFTRLEPGQESPFVVQVPITAAVARYRVSFRAGNGGVIAHVDRRNAGPLAKKE